MSKQPINKDEREAYRRGLEGERLSSTERKMIAELAARMPSVQAVIKKNQDFHEQMKDSLPPAAPNSEATDQADASMVETTFLTPWNNLAKNPYVAKPKNPCNEIRPHKNDPRRSKVATSWDWDLEHIRTFAPDPTLTELGSFETPSTPADRESFDRVRDSLVVIRSPEVTLVSVIAVDQNRDGRNEPTAIRCFGGVAFAGYAHDLGRDSYLVNCVECMSLGRIPYCYVLTLPNVGNWTVPVPMPEAVLVDALSPLQRDRLEHFRLKYPQPRFTVEFVQMRGCE